MANLRAADIPGGPSPICRCGGRKNSYSLLCRTCRGSSRRDIINPRFAPERIATEVDVAYAAGFYEGEGTVGCYGESGGFNVKIYQMHSDWPLRKIREFIGGNLYLRSDGCYVLELAGKLAHNFLALVWDHLSPYRIDQAEKSLQFLADRRDRQELARVS